MRTTARIIAWAAVTVASILIANTAVGSVRNQVSDLPRASTVTILASAPSTSTPPASTTSSSTSAPMASTTSSVVSTSSTAEGSTTSSTGAAPATSPSTTQAPESTTTAAPGDIKTYSTAGGSVSLEVFSDRIRLLGAVPATGYSVEEIEQSQTKVEIEFKSGESEVQFHAELRDGELKVEIDEDDD